MSLGFVFPGNDISTKIMDILHLKGDHHHDDDDSPNIKLGEGLIQKNESIVSYRVGHLLFQKPNKFWVEGFRQKRYIPAPNDLVIGIINSRSAEGYKVDLGSSLPAQLPILSFEGTTKKNKPILNVGDAVLAKVVLAHIDMEPELSCFDDDDHRDNNPLKESKLGLGEIKGSKSGKTKINIFRCSVQRSRELQKPSNTLLPLLGKYFSFSIIVGANGAIILETSTSKELIRLSKIILNAPIGVGKEEETEWVMRNRKSTTTTTSTSSSSMS